MIRFDVPKSVCVNFASYLEFSAHVFLSLFQKASVELYEGKSQANSTVWSSLDAPQLPMIERQSYIIPANVVNLKETITEKGITNKHVLSKFKPSHI